MSRWALVSIEPDYPKQYIAKGTRTVNGLEQDYFIYYTAEGGGWYQWGGREQAKLFTSEKGALDAARSAPGPSYNMPAESTIVAVPVDSPKVGKYSAFIDEHGHPGAEILSEILTARDALRDDDEPISFRAAALLEALEKLGDA